VHKLVIGLSFCICSSSVLAERLPADPTRPAAGMYHLSPAKRVAPVYKVSSLVTGKKKNTAVVNGQRVEVGDLVDSATVLSISREGVMLDIGNKQQLISLSEREGFSKVKSGK
jgi:hypothetical protein